MEFENDLAKPWRWEEDGLTVTRTCAWSPPGCHPVACGLKLYVKDGELIRVEGDENHPITQGRLCPRCIDLVEQVYSPERIIHPMKRAREDRGKDKWVQITLDEAYAIVKEKRDYYVNNYGAQSMITFTGTGRQGGGMGGSAACRTLGTPNNCYCQSGQSCYGPRTTSTIFLMGQAYPEIDYAGGLVDRYDDPRFEVPKYIMLWGKAPLESNGDGLFGHAIIDLMKRGAKIMSVDPRVNWINTRAEHHLRIRPGTDCALAMAMCDIIIKEDLYDHDFVEKWVYGFDEYAERVATMPAEKAAEICGVPLEEIYAMTRAYATSHPSSICWGLAVDMSWNSVQTGQAIMGLMALTGNIDVPGGQALCDATDGIGAASKFGGKGWDTLDPELMKYQIGREEYPMSTRNYQTQMDMTLDTLLTGEPYKLRMGWIYSTNPIACDGEEPKKWLEGFNNLEFNMVTDLYMTPTAMAIGDLFLPLAMFPEQDAVVGNHYGGSPTLEGAINKAYSVGECKSDFEYTYELGKLCNPDAWEGINSVEDWINAYGLFTLPIEFEQLRTQVYHRRKAGEYRKYETGQLRKDGKPGFETWSGRLELYSLWLQNYGEDPLPYYREPPMSPLSSPDLYEKYPFVLTTGARTFAFFHSEQRQIPNLREINPEPLVEINPKTADRLGIKEGDWVRLANDYGECRLVAHITWSVDEKTVMAQHGWWKPEEEGEAPHYYGALLYNPNNLIPNHHIGKTGYGSNIKSALCSVAKIDY